MVLVVRVLRLRRIRGILRVLMRTMAVLGRVRVLLAVVRLWRMLLVLVIRLTPAHARVGAMVIVIDHLGSRAKGLIRRTRGLLLAARVWMGRRSIRGPCALTLNGSLRQRLPVGLGAAMGMGVLPRNWCGPIWLPLMVRRGVPVARLRVLLLRAGSRATVDGFGGSTRLLSFLLGLISLRSRSWPSHRTAVLNSLRKLSPELHTRSSEGRVPLAAVVVRAAVSLLPQLDRL